MKKGMEHSLIVLVCSILIVYFVGFIAGIFTSGETDGEWYKSVKPAMTPPNWVFPVVWNILFFWIALSLWLSWMGSKVNERRSVVWWYGANLVFNGLWSILYFGLHSPAAAFVDIIAILVTTVGMMVVSYRINKVTNFLLWPYLLWVIFAAVLNYQSMFR